MISSSSTAESPSSSESDPWLGAIIVVGEWGEAASHPERTFPLLGFLVDHVALVNELVIHGCHAQGVFLVSIRGVNSRLHLLELFEQQSFLMVGLGQESDSLLVQ